MDMAIPYLPPEILTNILVRVDLKTLSCLRFVNKFWFQFISSQDFAKAHLKNSKKDKSLSGHRVFFATSSMDYVMKQFSVESSLCDSSLTDFVNLEYIKDWLSRGIVWFVGSCDGPVCIVLNVERVLLLNPCTGKYKELCPLDIGEACFLYLSIGFGYDESNDDYKVVVLCYVIDEFPKSYHYVVKVNSLKRNYWETIDQNLKGRASGWGKIAGGKVHWLSYHQESGVCRTGIISFDVGSEVFGIVEQPSYGDGRFDVELDVLDGCICLLVSGKRTHADLWVMKEYGVKESWIKVVTISCISALRNDFTLRPLSMLPNGEILFGIMESFAVYNPKDDSFRSTGISKTFCYVPGTYTQSLVSPVGPGRRGRRKQSC